MEAPIGYGWGGADTTFSGLPNPVTFFSLATRTLDPDPKGIVGGGELGFNWQTGQMVVGLEADFDASDMNGSAVRSPILDVTGAPSPTGFLQASQKTDWFGTLRARVGFTPADRWLLYVTGGLAYARVNYSAVTDFRPAGNVFYAASVSETKVGWTLGGGTEWAVGGNWTTKLEYLYYDPGNETFVANPSIALPPFQVEYDSRTSAQIVRVGVNYKFDQ